MKIVVATKALQYVCDECSSEIKIGEKLVNLREHSNELRNDTSQALICIHCVAKSLKLLMK